MENINELNYSVFTSPLDERDHIYGNLNFIQNGIDSELPEKFILSTSCIKDQKNSNFCAGFGSSTLLEAYYARVTGEMKTFSPLWNMKISKETDGRPDVTGTYLRNIVAQLIKKGGVEEKYYPTDADKDWHDNKFPVPSNEALENAKLHKPPKYARLTTTKEMKHAIVFNGGCVWAIKPYDVYYNHYKRCFVKRPVKGTEPVGGHGIACIGYDDTLEQYIEGIKYKGFFILQESYGVLKGNKGLIYVPYAYIDEKVTGLYSVDTFFQEAWSFYDPTNVKEPEYHFDNEVNVPKKRITLVVGSKTAIVNDEKKTMIYPATVMSGTTLVPFRFLAELFDCAVNYISSEKRITALHKNMNCLIEMTTNDPIIKNTQAGKHSQIIATYPPTVINGNTLVPIRAFSEMMECKVDYDPKTKTISILGMM